MKNKISNIEIMAKMSIQSNGEEWLETEIIVEDKPLVDFSNYAINYSELIRSVRKKGEYYILTCSCGIAECAGIGRGVNVNFVKDRVEWYFLDPFPIKDKNFIFEVNSYVKAIRLGFDKARELVKIAQLEGKKFCQYPTSEEILPVKKQFYFSPFGETVFLKNNWRKR